ncbi:hypothetical protein MUK42_07183 [Musa troglodytarum]|uniref:Uncharacterized protein n=1 Tax=Musa troglodytarum TaxID=320322 RepID=A0A9E7HR31_9LILI|nr:hypothetical protein MUK42_07183 [Musa troglodytarum]
MRDRERGHRNSTGISDTVMEDVGALPEAEEGERWWLGNLQNDLRLPIHSPVTPSSSSRLLGGEHQRNTQ